MFDGNDIVEVDGGGEGNLMAHLILAGAAVGIAGISWACGAMTGKSSAAKENKRLMWSIARTKQERLRVFGKDQYEYLEELFEDEENYDYDENGEFINSNGRAGRTATKKKARAKKI
jgi:hypothetical protein